MPRPGDCNVADAVQCLLMVYDSLLTSSTATTVVAVTPSPPHPPPPPSPPPQSADAEEGGNDVSIGNAAISISTMTQRAPSSDETLLAQLRELLRTTDPGDATLFRQKVMDMIQKTREINNVDM